MDQPGVMLSYLRKKLFVHEWSRVAWWRHIVCVVQETAVRFRHAICHDFTRKKTIFGVYHFTCENLKNPSLFRNFNSFLSVTALLHFRVMNNYYINIDCYELKNIGPRWCQNHDFARSIAEGIVMVWTSLRAYNFNCTLIIIGSQYLCYKPNTCRFF